MVASQKKLSLRTLGVYTPFKGSLGTAYEPWSKLEGVTQGML